jgi:hypothetical protein
VYAVQLDKRIMPLLGGYQLRQITPQVVRGFTADMQANGDGPRDDGQDADGAAVDPAARRDRRGDPGNPVKLVGKPSQARERQPILVSPEQVEAIRARLPLPDATLVSMLAYAGLRPESEAITADVAQRPGTVDPGA